MRARIMRVNDLAPLRILPHVSRTGAIDGNASLGHRVPQRTLPPRQQGGLMSRISQCFQQQKHLMLSTAHLRAGVNVQNP
jgi:hypothetical protein